MAKSFVLLQCFYIPRVIVYFDSIAKSFVLLQCFYIPRVIVYFDSIAKSFVLLQCFYIRFYSSAKLDTQKSGPVRSWL